MISQGLVETEDEDPGFEITHLSFRKKRSNNMCGGPVDYYIGNIVFRLTDEDAKGRMEYILKENERVRVAPDEELHDKYFNPEWSATGGQLYGLSPLRAAMTASANLPSMLLPAQCPYSTIVSPFGCTNPKFALSPTLYLFLFYLWYFFCFVQLYNFKGHFVKPCLILIIMVSAES